METTRIAVTGIGIYSSIGNSRQEFWDALISGESGAGHIQCFDASGFKSRVAAEIKNFAPEDYLPKKRIRRMARFSQIATCAALQAVEDSGLEIESMDPLRIGTVVGTAAGIMKTWKKSIRICWKRGLDMGTPWQFR